MEQQPCLRYKRAVRDKHKFYRNSRTFRSFAAQRCITPQRESRKAGVARDPPLDSSSELSEAKRE